MLRQPAVFELHAQVARDQAGDLVLEAVQITLGLLYAVVRRKGVEQPVAAADGGAVVDLERETRSRREVGLLDRQPARQPREEFRLFAVTVGVEVVPKPQVERQPVRDAPVVLDPRAPDVPEDIVAVLGVGRGVLHEPDERRSCRRPQGGNRRRVPCRRVIDVREHLLNECRRRCGAGRRIDHTIAAETPDERVGEPDVFAAQSDVVASFHVERRRIVVAHRCVVLKDVER